MAEKDHRTREVSWVTEVVYLGTMAPKGGMSSEKTGTTVWPLEDSDSTAIGLTGGVKVGFRPSKGSHEVV